MDEVVPKWKTGAFIIRDKVGLAIIRGATGACGWRQWSWFGSLESAYLME